MDQPFLSFKTDNRKKFLSRVKANKNTDTPSHSYLQAVLKIQNNVRRCLHLKRAQHDNRHLNLMLAHEENFLLTSSTIVQTLENEKSNLFVISRMILLGIVSCHRRLEKQDVVTRDKLSDLILQKLNGSSYQVIEQIFKKLFGSEKQYFICNVLPFLDLRPSSGFNQSLIKTIAELFITNINNFYKFLQNANQPEILFDVMKIVSKVYSAEKCELGGTQFNEKMIDIYQRAYTTTKKYLYKIRLQILGMTDCSFVSEFLRVLIGHLNQHCELKIMRSYKISPQLLRSQTHECRLLIRSKDEWLGYVEWLQLNSKLIGYLVERFLNLSVEKVEESMRMSDCINEILETSTREFETRAHNQNLMLILQKIIAHVQLHKIDTDRGQQKLTKAYLQLLNVGLFATGDKQFVRLFNQQHNQMLTSIIKDHLMKLLYRVIFICKPNELTDKITVISISILKDLYDKVFRTGVLKTDIFANHMLTKQDFEINDQRNDINLFISNFPFVVPLRTRFMKFKDLIGQHRFKYYGRRKKLVIRRGNEFIDAFNALKDHEIQMNLDITFQNKLGIREDGIDIGGPSKQFINRVLKKIFSPKFEMFIENSERELLPHPIKAEADHGIIAEYYVFIGKIIGKAINENITIGPKFAGPFLNALIGKKNSFEDLKKVDKDLYNSLYYIRTMEEDAKELELTFEYKDEIRKKLISLKRNGGSIAVTNENKYEYVSRLANYKVNSLLEFQSRNIQKGLEQVIKRQWLRIFNYEELSYLISGSGVIDIDELFKFTRYNGYTANSLTIKCFWEVLKRFDEDKKAKFLMFVTSSPRPSFLGFQDLNPHFTIVNNSASTESLPVSHTCSNLLELPEYNNSELLEQKLIKAIESESGYYIG